jgi:hypothetical protein
MKGVAIPGFKLTKDGKVEKDERAIEARLDVSARISRRKSKKVTFVKRGGK